MTPTPALPPFIEAMSLFNKRAIYRIQLIKALQLNAHILTGMEDFVKKNDRQLGWSASGNWMNMLVNAGLNYYEYWHAFDKGAGLNPAAFSAIPGIGQDLPQYKYEASRDIDKNAQAIMAEIANATRSHRNLYNRSDNAAATLGAATVVGEGKQGQTRLIGRGGDIRPDPAIDAMRTQPAYRDTTGDRLASDDYLTDGFGMGTMGTFVVTWVADVRKVGDGIRADPNGGEHFRHQVADRYQGPGRSIFTSMWPSQPSPRDSFGSGGDSNHKFGGTPYIAPYFKFNISGKPEAEYNQPSVWMYLNKRPESFQTGANKKPWHMDFTVNGPARGHFQRTNPNDNTAVTFQAAGGRTASLDTTIGGERQALMNIMEGLNVLSRAQVYYHRPNDRHGQLAGGWQEQPNFFNPFWRARLAPIAQKLTNLWQNAVGNSLVPGPEAGAVQAMIQNFVNNALADFFFRTVTGLITH